MRTVGLVITVMGAVVALFAIVLGIRSIPDLQRYLRIRSM